MLHTFNRYQDVERSTATARARTAKQFEEFLQPDNVRLFPNLKWLPSRSADPRVSHTAFYNRVWAKDDPFWNTNAPGTEWNCKCDIEETDEPLTDNTALPQPAVPAGLEGNPAQTAEIFTDNASYIRACRDKQKVEEFVSKILHNHAEFMQYKQNSEYKDVTYDYNSGGMMAVHNSHQLHQGENEERYFAERLSSGELEIKCGRQLMQAGHKVVFVDETRQYVTDDGTIGILPTLDILLDGKPMDIRSVTKDSTLHQHLSYKSKQLKKVKEKTGIVSDCLCLYFHKPEYFSEEKIQAAITRYRWWCADNPTIKNVYIVRKGHKDVLHYEI